VAVAVPVLRTVQLRLTSACAPALAGPVSAVTTRSVVPIAIGTAKVLLASLVS
jgi:hypothetical protein